MQAHVEAQKELTSVFENFPDITVSQFEAIAAPLMQHKDELLAVEWAPKLRHAERASFEAKQSQILKKDFLVRERDQQKIFQSAAARDVYFPVLYIAPFEGNEKVFGFDLYSISNRRMSIQQAVESRRTVATEPVIAVQEKSRKLSVILITAARHKGITNTGQEPTQDNLESTSGVVISVLRPSTVLNNLLNEQDRRDIKLKLMSVNTNDKSAPKEIFVDEIGSQRSSMTVVQEIRFSERYWELQAHPTDLYLESHRPWAAWISLVAGMLFSGLVGMYFLMISGRAFQIESLVVQRTKQLQDSEGNRLAILEHAADGILTVSNQGEILSYNRAAEQSLALTGNALAGISLENFFTDGSNFPLSFLQLIASENPVSRTTIEVQRQRADGSLLFLELSIAKITQQSQAIYIVVMHDLTERKRIDKIKGGVCLYGFARVAYASHIDPWLPWVARGRRDGRDPRKSTELD